MATAKSSPGDPGGRSEQYPAALHGNLLDESADSCNRLHIFTQAGIRRHSQLHGTAWIPSDPRSIPSITSSHNPHRSSDDDDDDDDLSFKNGKGIDAPINLVSLTPQDMSSRRLRPAQTTTNGFNNGTRNIFLSIEMISVYVLASVPSVVVGRKLSLATTKNPKKLVMTS